MDVPSQLNEPDNKSRLQELEYSVMRVNNLLAGALLVLMSNSLVAAEQLFSKLDNNQDGVLAAEEIAISQRRLFDRLLRTGDSNQDGKLSSTEFQASLQSKQPEKPLVKKQGSELPGADALLLLLAKMDVNINGRVEVDELPSQLRQIFDRIEERLGGEPDGVLDRRELTQAAPRLSHMAIRFAERMHLDVEVELALLTNEQWDSVQNMLSKRSRGEVLADPKRAKEFFKQLDADGDGQITLVEVPDQIAERFEQLMDRADRNRDDQVSEAELMAISRVLQSRAKNRPSLNRPSPNETAQGIERLLKQFDRDGDRRISRKEAPRRVARRFEQLDRDGSGQLERKELRPIVELLSGMRRPELRPVPRSDYEMQSQE